MYYFRRKFLFFFPGFTTRAICHLKQLKLIFVMFVFVQTLMGCAHHHDPKLITPKMTSEFQQGKRVFEAGYYKRAMHMLLPLACDGLGEAEYAVGYMYYYGYGVAQDPYVGAIWINRAAKKGYPPAVNARAIISKDGPVLRVKGRTRDDLRHLHAGWAERRLG